MKMPDLIIPFHDDELTVIGEYPPQHPGEAGTPILKTPIKPYENMRLFLAGERPLWTPSFPEIKMFNPSILADNKARKMVLESEAEPSGGLYDQDYFGIEWEFVPAVHGAIVRPGTPKVADICNWEHDITFPDLSALDWAASAQANREYLNDSRCIQMAVFNGFFERLVPFADMENALVAMIDPEEQPAVHRLFDRLCVFYDELFFYLAKWYQPDLLWFHDDWGSQKGPLFSLDTCREMLVPYLKRTVESAHSYGIGFEFHSCGKNEFLVPAMIEAGVDMWCGQLMNDKERLYREYGDAIKLGVTPPVIPEDAEDPQIHDIIGRFLDTYPRNIYVGMEFGISSRFYPYLYEESRKR